MRLYIRIQWDEYEYLSRHRGSYPNDAILKTVIVSTFGERLKKNRF